MVDDHAEILRLRDRVHALANAVHVLGGHNDRLDDRLEALEKIVQDHVDEYEAKVDALIRTDEILEALKARSRVELTWLQRLGALVLFALTITDFIYRFTS